MVGPPKSATENQSLATHPFKSTPNKDVQQNNVGKDLPKENVSKEKDLQKDEVKKDIITIERSIPSFSL